MLKSYQGVLKKYKRGIHLRDLRLKEQKTLIANLHLNLASTQTSLKALKIVCLVMTSIVVALTLLLLVTQS
ncbi:hypothetical protein D3C78_1946990 [compost metagenome]